MGHPATRRGRLAHGVVARFLGRQLAHTYEIVELVLSVSSSRSTSLESHPVLAALLATWWGQPLSALAIAASVAASSSAGLNCTNSAPAAARGV